MIEIIPIHGSDTNWGGFDSAEVGNHFGNIPWDATTAAFAGTGVVVNQGDPVSPNFIAHTNYLNQGFGATIVHFATPQDGVAMYLRHATESFGNALTFVTHNGAVTLSIADIDHALGFNGPTGAHGSFENIGFEIEGVSPFQTMLMSSGTQAYGVFADTSRDFNTAPATPEMGTWAMLLCGFAMMGVAMVRRARTARAIA